MSLRSGAVLSIALAVGETPASAQATPTDVMHTVLELRAIHPPDESADVPVEARAALAKLKVQMEAVMVSHLNAAGASADPQAVRAEVVAALSGAGVSLGADSYRPHSDQPQYGGVRELTIERPLTQPNSLATLVTLAIPYGSDTLLTLYSWRDGRWTITARASSDLYSQIDGALEGMRYAVSPIGDDGSFTLVTASVRPWPSSCWSTVDLAIRRIGSGQNAKAGVRSEEFSAFTCDGHSLTGTDRGFTLRFVTTPEETTDFKMRERRYEYRPTGGARLIEERWRERQPIR